MKPVATIHPSWEGNTEINRYLAIVMKGPGDYILLNKRSSQDLTTALRFFNPDAVTLYERVNGFAWQKIVQVVRGLNSGNINPDLIRLEDLLINPIPLEEGISVR